MAGLAPVFREQVSRPVWSALAGTEINVMAVNWPLEGRNPVRRTLV